MGTIDRGGRDGRRSRTIQTTPPHMRMLGFNRLFLGRSEEGFKGIETAFRLSPRDPDMWLWQFYHVSPPRHLVAVAAGDPMVRQGGQRAQSRASSHSSTSPPPTPGRATTRKRRKPSLNCKRSFRASPCRAGWASTGATIRPSMRNISASSKGLRKAGVPEGEKKAN